MTLHRELRPCELLQLEKFRPRGVRRNWRATFWKALRLLVLSALCGAAWSAAKAAEPVPHAQPLTQRERAEGVWIAGGLLLGLLALLALAVRKQGRERRGLGEAYAEENPYAGHWADYQPLEIEKSKMEIGESWDVGPLECLSEALIVSPSPSLPVSESDPLALPAEGLTTEETARILKAIAAELKLTRELVRGAQRSIGAEDYGDALDGAERRLGLLRTTTLELRAKFQGKDAPQKLDNRRDEGTGLTGVTGVTDLDEWAVAVETALGQIEREHECGGTDCGVCDALTSVDAAPISSSQGLPVSQSLTGEASGA